MVQSASDTRIHKKKQNKLGRTAWEALLDMEKYTCNVEEIDHEAVTLVEDLATAFEKVQ